jgi:glycosyltransferase involved in cell wall biosynthesis
MPRGLSTFHVNTESGWRGGEQQMAYLMAGLARRGHRVVAVVQQDGAAYPRLAAAGFDVHALRMRGEADPVALLALARRMGTARPDVVHLHTSHAHTLGALAARLANHPVVIVSRRVDFSIYRHSFLGLNGIKYRTGIDRIVCVSDAVRDVLVRDGLDPARLRVVRSAIDPDRVRTAAPIDVRARLRLPRDARIVLAVGDLVGHKGHRHLVEALPSLVAAVHGVHVVIAGEGPLRADLEAQAKALWLQGSLHMPGRIDDLPGWFSSAEVLCMPSVEEGLGTSVLDGMAAGLPVVASRAGGIPEMVRDGIEGLLVPPGDPRALSAALARLLGDADLRRKMSDAARRRVDEAFHVDRMVEETLAVYREAIRERTAPSTLPSPI